MQVGIFEIILYTNYLHFHDFISLLIQFFDPDN